MDQLIKTICICGSGTMGSGIAQVAALSGFHTILFDVQEEMIRKASVNLEASFEQLVAKGKITSQERADALGRLRFTKEINDCLADVVIEAIVEKPDIKIALFNQLAEINHREVIFASNTSSLSITEIAQKVSHPERVAGLHFFNPAPVMKLVEVVKTSFTNEHTITTITQLAQAFGKTTVLCQDAPGFIVNHVARPYYLEALKMAEEGIASYETIDALLEAAGFKMGPFRLMDLIGNDVNYAVSCSVYEQLGKPARLEPSPLQKERVDKGELGRKTRKGYYHYS